MYSELSLSEQILLSAEFLARGSKIPKELEENLGTEIISVLIQPERREQDGKELPK